MDAPQYRAPSNLLMVSPSSTDGFSPQYLQYPQIILNTLQYTTCIPQIQVLEKVFIVVFLCNAVFVTCFFYALYPPTTSFVANANY